MPTASYESFSAQDFFDLLNPDLPGADLYIIRQEIDRVMRHYFRGTGAWHDRFKPNTPFAAGQVRVDLNEELRVFSAPYRVGHVYEVWEGDIRVVPQNQTRRLALDARHGIRLWRTPNYGVVEFSGKTWAEQRTNLEYQVSLYPEERSVEYPQWIWDDHSEAIQHGVLGRLQTQIKKPYSNPIEGVAHKREYRIAMAKARAIADRGGSPDGATWQYPRTF